MKKRPLLIGLTGSIGMGKSVTARLFEKEGAAVFCADSVARSFLRPGGKAEKKIKTLFPEALWRGHISRKRLGAIVFADPSARKKLEKILHPLVFAARAAFIERAARKKQSAVLLDIPLLFETGEDKKVDVIVCVSAPKKTQEKRVLKRKNMTRSKLRSILASQWPDEKKRRRATYVVKTDKGLADARRQVKNIWKELFGEKHARNRS